MKNYKIIFLLLLSVFLSDTTFGQKFAYVDTDYILDMIPEYRSAQKQLDALSEQWQKEMESKSGDIDKMIREFEAEKVLLTEDMKKRREGEIKLKDNELKDFRTKKFGYEGELFKKRQELIKPIQDRVFDAIQKVAKSSAIDFIFAKSAELTILYTNAKYDKSDEVLKEMGVSITTNKNLLKGEGGMQNNQMPNKPNKN